MPRKTAARFAAPLLFLAAALGAQAQTRQDVLSALSAPVESFAFPPPGKPAAEIFDAISREYNIPIVLDREVTGDVSFRIYGTRLRGVLDAICQPRGWHYEIVTNAEDSYAYVAIRRFVSRTYSVDYLQLSQSASSTASVSIAGSTGSGTNNSTNGVGSNNGTNGTNGTSSGGGGGSSSVSLSSSSDVDFWSRFEADAKTFVEDGESLVINRFAGLVQLRASLRTHAQMQAYIDSLMARVKRSATVTVQIVRVDLNNSSKLGVDWSVAAFQLGRDGGRNAPIIGGAPFANAVSGGTVGTPAGPNTGSSTSAIGTIGSAAVPANTFQTVIQAGKVSALLTALKEQGDVTISNRAFVYALNNQMGLAQISLDEPQFTRETDIEFSTTSNTGGTGTVPTSRTNYTKEIVSIGAVFEITPQIDDNLTTTIAISPSLTDLRGEKESPDGQSSALRVGVRRFRSTVILQNGETALLGGYIEAQEGATQRSIPGLGAIPVLGRAFRTDAKIRTRSEYIILVSVEAKNAERSAPMQVAEPSADQSVEGQALARQARVTGQLSDSMHKALNAPSSGVTKPVSMRMVEPVAPTPSEGPSQGETPASTIVVPADSEAAAPVAPLEAEPATQVPAVELLGGS